MQFRASSLLIAAAILGASASPALAQDGTAGGPPSGDQGDQGKGAQCKCPQCKCERCKCGKEHRQGGMMGGSGHMGGHPMMMGSMMGHGMMMGHGGMGWYRHMRGHVEGHYWRGPEFTYHTGMNLAGTPNSLGQYVDIGKTRRFEFNDFLAIGFSRHLAYQLAPATGQGNWIVPYCGVEPRLGVMLGPVRLDAGAMAGLGGMLRTSGGDVLQGRLMWVLEPNVELSHRMEHMNVGLRAGYMMSPNPGDFGGVTVGLRVGFGGFYAAKAKKGAPGKDKADDQDHDHDDED